MYGRQGSSEGGSLSPAGSSLPALGHPGWKHSLTWAGSARRRAGCQAQNLPGVSDGCGASFQRPLIIQRSSLSVHLFLLSLPIHSPPYITYSVHAYTQVHTHCTHPDAHHATPDAHTKRASTHTITQTLDELTTHLHIPHTRHICTTEAHRFHTPHTYTIQHTARIPYLCTCSHTCMHTGTQTYMCAHTAVSISHPRRRQTGPLELF